MRKAGKLQVLLMVVFLISLIFVACSKDSSNFKVSVPTDLQGGYIVTSAEEVEKGGEVTLTVYPDLGYELDWLKVNGEDATPADGINTVKVSNIQEDLKVTAQFAGVDFTITANESENGTYTVAKSGNYGDEIKIEFTPATGYQLEKVEIGKNGGGSVAFNYEKNTFVMPSDDISITVTFSQIQVGTPVLKFDNATHKLTWDEVENASGYSYSLDYGKTYTPANDRVVTLEDSAVIEVWVKALGNGETNFDSDPAIILADNRIPLSVPQLVVTDNMTDAFTITWDAVENASGYRYRFTRNGETDLKWTELGADERSIEFPYTSTPVSMKIELIAVGDDSHMNSDSAFEEFAITAPSLKTDYPDTVIPYEGDTVEYTLPVSEFAEGTEGTVTFTKFYINTSTGNAGKVATDYNANGFTAGVYTGEITNGMKVTLDKECGYRLQYTLSNHFGLEEVVEQWIVVQNNDKINLLSEEYYPTLYSGSTFVGVFHFTVVENPGLELLGDNEVLRLKSDGSTVYANGTFINTVSLGRGTKLTFWVYNNSDYDLKFTLNGMPAQVGAKSYFYFNAGDVDPEAAGNYRTADGKLGKVTPYYDRKPIIEMDVRRDDGSMYPYELFIGGFLLEKEAFTLASPALTVEGDTVSWEAVPDAVGYQVSTDEGKTWGETFTETSYVPEDNGSLLTVYVRAVGEGVFKTSAASSAQVDFREKMASPTGLKAEKKTTDYLLSWNAVENAQSYKYRAIGVDGKPVSDWKTTSETQVSIGSDVYGSRAGEVTIQVSASAEGYADSEYAITAIELTAPSFTTVPGNQLIQLGKDTDKFYIGGEGAYRTDLATAEGEVTWTIRMLYACNVAGNFAGDPHPMTFAPNSQVIDLYNQFYTEITWAVTDAYGVSGTHIQYIFCPTSSPVKMTEISNQYADLYTKEGAVSGDAQFGAAPEGIVLNEKEDGGVLHMVKDASTATVTLSNNVFVGDESKPVQRFTFNVYNASADDITITVNTKEPNATYSMRANSYGNYTFYYVNPGVLYDPNHNILNTDGTLKDITFTVENLKGGNLDVYIGEIMLEESYDVLATPVLSVEESTVGWAAVPKADKYLVSVNGGESWTEQTDTTYSVEGSDVTVMVKAAANSFYRESAPASILVNESVTLEFDTVPDDILVNVPATPGTVQFYIAPEDTTGKNFTVLPTGEGTITYTIKMLRATNVGGNPGSLFDIGYTDFPGGIHQQSETDSTAGVALCLDFQYVIEWKLTSGENSVTYEQHIFTVDYTDITELYPDMYDNVIAGGQMQGVASPNPILGEGNVLHLYSAEPVKFVTGQITPSKFIGADTYMSVIVYNAGDKEISFNMYGTKYGGDLVVPAKTFAIFKNYHESSTILPSVHGLTNAEGVLQSINFQAANTDGSEAPIDCYVSHFMLSKIVEA